MGAVERQAAKGWTPLEGPRRRQRASVAFTVSEQPFWKCWPQRHIRYHFFGLMCDDC